ncbi:antigen WC1.1 isoform B [Alligator mississippiensis]|uniref:Antigen WC1.1 isoform B n=1 Tax=Alligator mississippiensis TaxID=8496 RepID=A0A151NVB0_ALLMI|nr:antigen WC1.1 isoform B [Alligator mississippiensis]
MGDGPVWNGTFGCERDESHRRDCFVTALGAAECPHRSAARVVCSGCPRGRLVNGTECSGRVEIQYGVTWGAVCGSQWDLQAAHVLCRQLKCGYAKSIPRGAQFGEVYGVRSPSSPHFSFPGDFASLRLLNGENQCDGRVEIFLDGVWVRVLDDEWNMNDANVVCRQLQCGIAEKAYNPSKSERGTGPVWLRSIHCSGYESRLTLCNTSVSETAQAGIAEDVGVICSDFVSLRLVNGGGCAGRLEVFYNGTWGSVCSNQMTQVTATIVCKQLSCGDEGEIATDFAYGQGSGLTWLDRIECHEHHSSLWQCPSEPWDPKSCDNRAEETHITCTGRKENSTQAPFSKCPNSTSCTDKEKLRVVGTEDRCSGRVEVWHRGSWGTVCDNSWDMADANVVCKQLGCGAAVSALGEAAYGEGTGPIWLDKLNCKGTESSLWDCCAEPWDDSKCHHKDDAAVICTGVTEMPTPPVKTGSKGPLNPFSEAVYEEIDYNLREKQEMFGYSEDSLMKLYYYTGDSEEGNEPGSAQEASAFPGDSYDDAREVSDPENDSVSAQSDQKVSGLAKNSCKKRGSRTGWSLLSLKSEGASGAEKNDSSLPPGDVGYDNVEDNITATSL